MPKWRRVSIATGWTDSKDPVLVRTIESREYNAPWRKGSTNYCKYRMEAPPKDSRLGLSDDRGPRNLDRSDGLLTPATALPRTPSTKVTWYVRAAIRLLQDNLFSDRRLGVSFHDTTATAED